MANKIIDKEGNYLYPIAHRTLKDGTEKTYYRKYTPRPNPKGRRLTPLGKLTKIAKTLSSEDLELLIGLAEELQNM